jgi:hypothetical protein
LKAPIVLLLLFLLLLFLLVFTWLLLFMICISLLLLLLPLLLLCCDGEVSPHLLHRLGALPLAQVGQQRSLKVSLADGQRASSARVPAANTENPRWCTIYQSAV